MGGGGVTPLCRKKQKKPPKWGQVVCGIIHPLAFPNLPGRGDKRRSPLGGSL